MCGETYECPRAIWLIKRGLRPEHHKAPYHPVVICSRKHTAKWEAGGTPDGAWIWEHIRREANSGWLLVRWAGLDIDHRPAIMFTLPDGTQAGIQHDRSMEPWTLLPGAVWWSDEKMPRWLADAGAVVASDIFTVDAIANDYGTCLLSRSAQERLERRRSPLR